MSWCNYRFYVILSPVHLYDKIFFVTPKYPFCYWKEKDSQTSILNMIMICRSSYVILSTGSVVFYDFLILLQFWDKGFCRLKSNQTLTGHVWMLPKCLPSSGNVVNIQYTCITFTVQMTILFLSTWDSYCKWQGYPTTLKNYHKHFKI